MPSTDQMKDILTKQLKAFSKGDWNTYRSTLAAEPVYEEEATARRLEGADAIVKGIEGWRTAFPDIDFEVREVVGAGNTLVVELVWTGTHRGPLVGPFGTLPPTNKFGKLPAIQVARFDGDLISEVRHYFDLMTLLRQIGVAPQLGAQPSP